MEKLSINTIELISILDPSKIESILKRQNIKKNDDNYNSEFNYRHNFELKKYLLFKYFKGKLPDNFISMVDKLEFVEIQNSIFQKTYELINLF